ncbi:MAG: aminotransferase class III-fold pyridoxal phosphate-dependent enzyme [Acidimicrobiia bacterium]|nr:aminotransferase class III-fold pyridoxal phosphate-dependent enzyme [Acidimicrobiia bacterium]
MHGPQAHDRYSFTAQAADPPTIVRADGVRLYTDDGREIIDAAGGAVVCNIGHGRPEVVDAVAAAMRELGYVPPIWPTPNRLALADRLVDDWLPSGFEHVFFAGGGSEANDTAVRLARLHHLARGEERRHKVIGRVPSYHGATIATLAIGGHERRRSGFEPLLHEYPKVPWDDADALAGAIEAAGPDTVAAFIAEPVIGAAGAALIAPPDYWVQVAEVCREYGVLTIADEVMTGFGRTGRRWGHEHDGWVPDVLVSAKGVGGGYVPLSLVSASNDVVDPVTEAGGNVMFFTYSAHDSTCAGALAVLDIIEREQLVDRAATQGAKLFTALDQAVGDHPQVVEVRGRGLMVGVELDGFPSLRVVAEALDRGVWIYPGGSGPTVNDGLLFAPPMIIDDEDIARIADVTARSIDAVATR